MSGIAERDRHPVTDGHGAIVIEGDELADGLLRIDAGVERFHGGQSLFGAFLGNVLGVGPLNFGRIDQHDGRQIPGGERAVDVPGEALLAEVGKIADVIDVGVGHHGAIEFGGIEGEVAIPLHGHAAPALIETAFQQDPLLIDLHEIHRSGGGPGGPEVVNAHAGKESRIPCRSEGIFSRLSSGRSGRRPWW